MFAPAISPVDPRMMMVNCDMSGAYLTRDGGKHWTMIHHSQLRSSTRCRPAFHPTDARIIFAAQAGAGMKVSHDGGLHWQKVAGPPDGLRGEIAIDPGCPDRMMAGDSRSVILSTDGGKSWRHCRGPNGPTVAFHFDQTSGRDQRVYFAATGEGIWRSDDGGDSWTEKTSGLPWKEIRTFSGGSCASDGRTVIYCAIPSKVENGQFAGGVYRSTDRGETWQSAMGRGINMDIAAADEWAHGPIAQYLWVLTTNVNPDIVYALNTNTGVHPPHHTATFRSDDAGATWRATFFPDPRFLVCNVEPDYVTQADGQFYQGPAFGAAIAANNPDHVIQVNEKVHITVDGGKTWKCGDPAPATGRQVQAGVPCNGLVLTSTWNYYIDPFEHNRHYIAYTDLGMARSLDAGRTWMWWDRKGRAPWQNTCYEMAFDPEVRGKIWAPFPTSMTFPTVISSTATTATITLEASASAPTSERPGSLAQRVCPRLRPYRWCLTRTARSEAAHFTPACSTMACTSPPMVVQPGSTPAQGWSPPPACESVDFSSTAMGLCSCSPPRNLLPIASSPRTVLGSTAPETVPVTGRWSTRPGHSSGPKTFLSTPTTARRSTLGPLMLGPIRPVCGARATAAPPGNGWRGKGRSTSGLTSTPHTKGGST